MEIDKEWKTSNRQKQRQMLCNRKTSQQSEGRRGMPYLIEMVLCAFQQCSQPGNSERDYYLLLFEKMPSHSCIFFISTVTASNFPALIVEYFFSPDILVHIFPVPLTVFPLSVFQTFLIFLIWVICYNTYFNISGRWAGALFPTRHNLDRAVPRYLF